MEQEVKVASDVKSAPIENIVKSLPVPAMIMDASWKISIINQHANVLLGGENNKSIDCASDLFAGTIEQTDCHVLESLRSGKSIVEDGIIITNKSGMKSLVTITATPVFDEANRVIGGLLILSPEKEDSELKGRVELYERILDALPWPLSVTDIDMNITFINQASLKILKRNRSEMLGKKCHEWKGPVCKTKNCGIVMLKKGISQTTSDRDGKSLQVDVSYLKDDDGDNVGHLEIVQDVTAKANEAKYRKAWFDQLRVNLKNIAEGNMEIDLSLAKPDEYTNWLFDDYSEINSNLGRARDSVKALITDTDILSNAAIHGKLDARVDASRHLGDYKKIVAGVNRTLDSVVGTFEAIPDPIMFIDKDFKIQYINSAGAKIRNKSKNELIGVTCMSASKTTHCSAEACPCAVAMRTKSMFTCDNETGVGDRHKDLQCTGTPLVDNAGNIVGAFEFVTNQTEIKNAARKANKVNEYQMATAKLLTNALEKISAGDLGYRVELPACDDDCRQAYESLKMLHIGIRTLKEEFSEVIDEVHRSIEQVSSTSQELAASSEEMNASTEQVSSAIQQIAKGAQNQSAKADETARAMTEMSSSVVEVVEKSQAASKAAGRRANPHTWAR